MNKKENRPNTDNPYQDSIAGLEIAAPVRAFFDWCIEREAIRVRREAGEPPPWTQDPVFQKGRFLNVFREDDKGTKAVLRFADPVKASQSDLIHALFFARWETRQRRAFSDEEMVRLLAVAGPRRAIYLMAVHTGDLGVDAGGGGRGRGGPGPNAGGPSRGAGRGGAPAPVAASGLFGPVRVLAQ